MKKLLGFSLLILLSAASPSFAERNMQGEAEELVRDFYVWFFANAYVPGGATSNAEILKYIPDEMVEFVRSPYYCGSASYFVKLDKDFMNWDETRLIVHPATELRGIYIIPVTFKGKHHTYSVIVLVKNDDNGLRISKIMDMYPYL